MGDEWSKSTLEELSSDVSYGYTESASEDAIGPHFLRITDIQNGVVDWQSVPYCPISEKDYRKYKLHEDDIVVARTGNSTGENYLFEGDHDAVFASYLIRFRIDDSLAHPKFVWYTMRSANWWAFVNGSKTGSAQAGANAKVLGRFPVDLPPLPKQKAIAHILSTLDDKIELNRQMNATLESMAQALFNSWFVDFDPVIDKALAAGHTIPDPLQKRADVRRALGKKRKPLPAEIEQHFPSRFVFCEEMGWVPEGWEIATLGDVCQTITDGAHASPKSVELGYPMASVKDMHNWGIDLNGCRKISEKDFRQLVRNNCKPQKNDVLIAKDGSYLKHIFVVEKELNLVLLSSIAVLRPNERINAHFLSFTLKRRDVLERMKNYVSGAVLQRIILKDFRRFEIVLPPALVQANWFNIVGSSIEKCWVHIHENESLANLRDTLLPKLLSGQLRIPDAEKLIEEAI